MRRSWLPPALLLLAAGCAPQSRLIPMSGASASAVEGRAAQDQAQGVRLLAGAEAWRGNPGDLEDVLTPLQVRLENHSNHPLRLSAGDFRLVGESGFQYASLVPFQQGSGASAPPPQQDGPPQGGPQQPPPAQGESGVVQPSASLPAAGGFTVELAGYHRASGFGVRTVRPSAPVYRWSDGPRVSVGWGWAPRSSRWGWRAGYSRWGWGPGWGWGWAPGWYGPPPVRVVESLPTRDMVRRALPEGTLQPGASVTGYLYFPDVAAHERRVTLQARLVDAQTGEQFGLLEVPFDVRE